MKKILTALTILSFLAGCANNDRPSINKTNDAAIGYEILKAENHKVSVLLNPQKKGSLKEPAISFAIESDQFSPPKANEKNTLILEITSPEDEKSMIHISEHTLGLEEFKKAQKQINEMKSKNKHLKIINQKTFTISQENYKKIANAKSLDYKIKANIKIENSLTKDELQKFKDCSLSLLKRDPFYEQTPEEQEKGINDFGKKFFRDFEVLKKDATKKDLEAHFNKKFKNTKKNPATQCYEEIIIANLGGLNAPLVIGFNDEDSLQYVRDVFDETKITWLKKKKKSNGAHA